MDEPNSGQGAGTGERVRVSHASRRAERARVVSEFRASGLTQEQFAAKEGVKLGALRAWLYKKTDKRPGEVGGFAPVRIIAGKGNAPGKSRSTVTLRWPQGIEVEIAVDLDGPGMERLVDKLLSPCLR